MMFALLLRRYVLMPAGFAALRIARATRKAMAWNRARLTHHALCTLNDHTLADIGLMRTDLASSEKLSQKAQETGLLQSVRHDF